MTAPSRLQGDVIRIYNFVRLVQVAVNQSNMENRNGVRPIEQNDIQEVPESGFFKMLILWPQAR